jgi:uncharacterized membrane protein YraQ (UPF0718 family)/copper chaperone CopZ
MTSVVDFIKNYVVEFGLIFSEMAPYLLLGFLIAGVLHAFMPKQKIDYFFNGSALGSSVRSAIFGIPLPLCSCGVIPTGIGLFKNGASKSGTISFLISTPQTGVDSILATFSLMGWAFAIIRPIAALVTGITGGIITSKVESSQTENKLCEKEELKTLNFFEKLKLSFDYGFVKFLQDISTWLLVGVLLATLVSVLIPDDFMSILGLSPIYQMLAILIISIPLYICATGSIPLAAILILKGVSPGAAFVLLMAGPATNMATITMIGKVLGRKSLIVYLATIILGALSFGFLIDNVFPVEWFVSSIEHLNHKHNSGVNWLEISSAILLSIFIINAYLRKRFFKIKVELDQNDIPDLVIFKVEGMTCNHCKTSVENCIKEIENVDNVIVELSNKRVVVYGVGLNQILIKTKINELGFKVLE